MLKIMSNFIPNETVIIDDRDPPWINSKMKFLIQTKMNILGIVSNQIILNQ